MSLLFRTVQAIFKDEKFPICLQSNYGATYSAKVVVVIIDHMCQHRGWEFVANFHNNLQESPVFLL